VIPLREARPRHNVHTEIPEDARIDNVDAVRLSVRETTDLR
jgi:hypothetical protein